ncbi:MAG: molybdopterin molybdotransferase MoeA [Sphingomonadales bacterium]|nr:molybdopterin molybdotransferase MoeA [Sphingomonadales bacterium]
MTGLIDFDTALARLAATAHPLPVETVPLAAAAGRWLSAPVIARCAAPRAAVSAMDGYAVNDAATRPGMALRVIGEARPGAPFSGAVSAGETVRIFTGGPLPVGTDRVIVQEQATRSGDEVSFAPGYGPARYVRAAGSDFAAGDRLLERGTRLTPLAMVAAAAADLAVLEVHRRPRVAILGTGDELALPGTALERPLAVPDSVTHAIAALVEADGGEVVARVTGGDDLAALTASAGDLLAAADIVVVTGGASVGAYDFARAAFAAQGYAPVFARVAIKPGKPVWFGTVGDRLVLGLPGNPTSAMVTATLFLRPLLARLQGAAAGDLLRWRHLPLAAPLAATDERETFARALWDEAGLVPLVNQDSGAQAMLARADWLIRCPAGSPARGAGEMVRALAL